MKKLIAGALALAMALGLAACGTTSGSSQPASTGSSAAQSSAEPVVITAMIQQSRNFDGLQAMIQKLEEEENIIIDAQIVPDDEALNLIQMQLNSGEAPDIIDYNVPAIYDIVDPAQYFADMTDEEWTQKLLIPDNVVNSEDGKIYGFPFLSVPGTHGFIYNKDVFEAAGVTEEPATWQELLDACEKIKATGVTPIYMPRDSWVPQVLMTDNFAKILGADGCQDFADKVMRNEIKWTDVPEFAQVIDTYLDLYKKGYVNDNFASAVYDDAIAAVADGSAAMHFNGDFFAASVLQANPDANIGMFAVSMTDGVDVVTENMSSAGFVANKNSENLDTVKKVFNLWATPEYANRYLEDRPAFPAFEGVDGGPVPSYMENIYETYIQPGKAIPEFNYYVMDLNALCESTPYVYYVDAPARGNMDGAAILAQFQTDFEQFMKDQGAEGF